MCYGAVAQSLLAGEGLQTPIHRRELLTALPVESQWPPGFPALLALASLVTGSVQRGGILLAATGYVALGLTTSIPGQTSPSQR